MTNLRKRLGRLEARITDAAGLIPHTPPWVAYWKAWFCRHVRGEKPRGRMPLHAARIIMWDSEFCTQLETLGEQGDRPSLT